MAKLIADLTGFKGKMVWDKSKPDGVKRKLLDSSKINNYGFKVKTDLIEGLQNTIKWYKDNCL